jgi:hypothetical protein
MFPCTASDVVRSRDKNFYTGIQRLTERSQECVENDENFVEK